MSQRLPFLAAVVALVIASGCAGVLGEDDPTYVTAPVEVDEGRAADAGLEHRGSDSFEVDETVDVGGRERRIVMTTHVVTLRQQYRGAPLGHVVVLSTPRATVLGQGLNPLCAVGPERLVEHVLGRSSSSPPPAGSVEDLEPSGTVPMQILGAERTVERFDASGERGKVQVYLARFEHGDDYVIVFAVVPDDPTDGEEALRTVASGIRHEGR